MRLHLMAEPTCVQMDLPEGVCTMTFLSEAMSYCFTYVTADGCDDGNHNVMTEYDFIRESTSLLDRVGGS